MEYQVHTLGNGIRLLHREVNSPVGHAALMVSTGSRDEAPEEQGMAHFIEHVIFKGTKKRKAYHIISRLEDVGGELNAYTAKEETCIHASFLPEYFDRTLELFADITFQSIFPAKELEKEKEIILDEINSYLDSPSEQIFDDFEEQVFVDHPLGKNILGTPKIIKSFKQKDVKSFIRRNYFTDEMVLCTVGNISLKKIVRQVEKYFAHVPTHIADRQRLAFDNYQATENKIEKDTYQTHCIMGKLAYSVQDPKRVGLFLLTNLIGGPGLNSRLNLLLREKHGYAYNVESNFTPYSDTGLFSIYFGTDRVNLQKSLRLINKEFRSLMDKKIGSMQLHRAKKQLIGQMAISNENHVNQMLGMAKSYLVFGRCDSLEEVNRKINAITAEDLWDVANEMLNPDDLSKLVFY